MISMIQVKVGWRGEFNDSNVNELLFRAFHLESLVSLPITLQTVTGDS
jgi:hypothetical protein